jgi:penicillin V acylase-like amidase (Ntn superfamily)
MRTCRVKRLLSVAVVLTSIVLSPVQTAFACSRAVYIGSNAVITVRSMDWETDVVATNLWAFPRKMHRDSAAGAQSFSWTSKYGSVVAAAFDGATADGMNEEGLVANLLYLSEAQYQTARDAKQPPMSISVWAQYVLDNYATVAEAVADLRKESFYVLPVRTPDDQEGTVHLAISDATGDSAIFEYLDGELVIHHGEQYRVMTNSPVYDEQLRLNSYWKEIDGATLPGTAGSADRFVRASYYMNEIPKTASSKDAMTAVFAVIRNVSSPVGKPDVPWTLWRTVSDHKNKRYYFESTRSPNVFWVALADMDFTEGKPARKLTVSDGAIYSGNAAKQFQPEKPFDYLQADVK